jgi:hypothetical protein
VAVALLLAVLRVRAWVALTRVREATTVVA